MGYEAGIDQKILGDDLTGGVTWFHNDIRNLITSGPAPTFPNINIGRARTQGIEAYVAWKALETLTFRADYTYTDSLDATTRLALLRRPRHKASLGADWQAMDELQLDATLLYVGQQIDGNRDFSIPRLKKSDYVTLDLAASYKLTEMWSVFGRIENATDTNYQSPDRLPASWHRRLWRDQGEPVSMKAGVFAAAALLLVSGQVAAAPPQRIMSLKICTDELLLDLVPRVSYCLRDVSVAGAGGAADVAARRECAGQSWQRRGNIRHPSRPDPDRSVHGAQLAAAAGQERRPDSGSAAGG